MDMELITQIIAGLVGGNAAGIGLKKLSFGAAGNSIIGAAGGALTGVILSLLGPDAAAAIAGLASDETVQSAATGGAGGAILTALLGALKKAFRK